MAKKIRIGLLLFVLFLVAVNAWQVKVASTDWDQSLWMVVYPVNGDGSAVSAAYMNDLQKDDFAPVAKFMAYEAEQRGVTLVDPVIVDIAPEVANLPPKPPMGGNLLSIVWWSLKLRLWSFNNDTYKGPSPDARIFVLYYDPATHKELEQSVGIKEGMIGVVNGFAHRRMGAKNNVIIVHELLHTLGATDKYDLATGLPLFPDGYAEPGLTPRYPQQLAEIMGGVVPLSETKTVMPTSVWQTTVGDKTAAEIGW